MDIGCDLEVENLFPMLNMRSKIKFMFYFRSTKQKQISIFCKLRKFKYESIRYTVTKNFSSYAINK